MKLIGNDRPKKIQMYRWFFKHFSKTMIIQTSCFQNLPEKKFEMESFFQQSTVFQQPNFPCECAVPFRPDNGTVPHFRARVPARAVVWPCGLREPTSRQAWSERLTNDNTSEWSWNTRNIFPPGRTTKSTRWRKQTEVIICLWKVRVHSLSASPITYLPKGRMVQSGSSSAPGTVFRISSML